MMTTSLCFLFFGMIDSTKVDGPVVEDEHKVFLCGKFEADEDASKSRLIEDVDDPNCWTCCSSKAS